MHLPSCSTPVRLTRIFRSGTPGVGPRSIDLVKARYLSEHERAMEPSPAKLSLRGDRQAPSDGNANAWLDEPRRDAPAE